METVSWLSKSTWSMVNSHQCIMILYSYYAEDETFLRDGTGLRIASNLEMGFRTIKDNTMLIFIDN